MNAGHLFDGFGGLRRGFEQGGIETLWRLEILDGQDIRTEDPRSYRMVDLLAGGPPCVHTSLAAAVYGGRTNQSLWPEMLRFIKALKPRWVFVEQPGSVERHLIRSWVENLWQSGYGTAGRIVDAKHWVPQQRPRWYLVGRLGTSGVALWNHLYFNGIGGSRSTKDKDVPLYTGCCSDCMPGGVLSRVSKRGAASMGAGNAVPVPVALWYAERIKAFDLNEGIL